MTTFNDLIHTLVPFATNTETISSINTYEFNRQYLIKYRFYDFASEFDERIDYSDTTLDKRYDYLTDLYLQLRLYDSFTTTIANKSSDATKVFMNKYFHILLAKYKVG